MPPAKRGIDFRLSVLLFFSSFLLFFPWEMKIATRGTFSNGERKMFSFLKMRFVRRRARISNRYLLAVRDLLAYFFTRAAAPALLKIIQEVNHFRKPNVTFADSLN